MRKQQKTPFYNRAWFVSIAVFCIVQLLFFAMEKTGWIPNLRDFDGKLLGKVTELHFFKEWFQFYETQWFNLFTLFLAFFVVLQFVGSAVKGISLKLKG
ncbi:YfzA family protein [Solibacillus sp. MA9]|uniref:YfzA family protein n=1 Tax=Solibacillus palustris TaxID=2908203 RepID=A0ABS9UB38_9BACL|nr:YfzA family protein [Solibacillus sp. MA9]